MHREHAGRSVGHLILRLRHVLQPVKVFCLGPGARSETKDLGFVSSRDSLRVALASSTMSEANMQMDTGFVEG